VGSEKTGLELVHARRSGVLLICCLGISGTTGGEEAQYFITKKDHFGGEGVVGIVGVIKRAVFTFYSCTVL